jgi:hypothetical protein
MGPVETDIEHVDLDTDDGEPEPTTGVYVTIVTADGMRYSGHTACVGEPDLSQLALMVRRAAQGAGATHSPELGKLLRDD